MTNELLQVFPIPVHISKHEENIEKEFEFVKNIKYISNGNSGNIYGNKNFKSENTSVLEYKELKTINDFSFFETIG